MMQVKSFLILKTVLVVMLMGLWVSSLEAASVFILHAYSQEYQWTKRQHSAFIEYLQLEYKDKNIVFSTEHLDTKRINYKNSYGRDFANYLKTKYANYQPDAIYITDDNALKFALAQLPNLFPSTPIVFSGVNDYSVVDKLDPKIITGVFEKKEIGPNIKLMTNIVGFEDKIMFVGDGSSTYRAVEYELKQELDKFPRLKPVFKTFKQIDDAVKSVKICGCKYVFLTTIGGIKDQAGKSLSLHDIVTAIAKAGDFVLLSMEDAYLFEGVVGGYVTSGKAQGEMAAKMVVDILAGKKLTSIPPVVDSPNEYIFNEQELIRKQISLPAEIRDVATIINPTLSFYEENKSLVLATILVLFVMLVVVLVVAVVLISMRKNELKQVAHTLSEQKNELIKTQNSLKIAQKMARLGSWSLDLVSNDLKWSDEIFRIFEIDKNKFGASYEAFLNAIHPDDRDLVNQAYTDSLKNKTSYEIEHRLLMDDGRIKYVQERCVTHYNDKDEPLISYGTVQDITDKKQDEKRIRQWASIFESTIEAVVITDTEQNIIDVNRAFTEITGYSKEEVIGHRPNIRRSERHNKQFYKEMWKSIIDTGAWTGEIWNRKKNGELSPEWHSISTIYDENGTIINYVGVFTDISVLKRSEEKLEHLANHDPLTELANRSLLIDRIERTIRRLERDKGHLAVLFLDLDRFKKVNDTLGHPVGDALLQEAALRLKSVIRNSDTIGRLGGDEFLVLIDGYDNISIVKSVAEKLRTAIEEPFLIDGNELYISVSIGISIYPDDGEDSSTLIRNADSALYRAKRNGRNGFSFYDYEFTKQAAQRLHMENILRHALDNDEFQLFFQPKVNLDTGRVIGAEALLRLQTADGKMLAPDEFIPVAEETGLIIPIGKWVLEQAIQQWSRWYEMGHILQMAINISAVQIQRADIIDTLIDIQKQYPLALGMIELEVTESVLIDFPEKAIEVLNGVRRLGHSIALDDFGTGFSSLSNLKYYPISTIKIDKSFVQDILVDPNDAAITRAVVAMGKSLEMNVVAEGVETEAHVTFLQELGCHQAQGYYYARPLSALAFTQAFLQK